RLVQALVLVQRVGAVEPRARMSRGDLGGAPEERFGEDEIARLLRGLAAAHLLVGRLLRARRGRRAHAASAAPAVRAKVSTMRKSNRFVHGKEEPRNGTRLAE